MRDECAEIIKIQVIDDTFTFFSCAHRLHFSICFSPRTIGKGNHVHNAANINFLFSALVDPFKWPNRDDVSRQLTICSIYVN